MNGVEHYRQAERLIALADEATDPTAIEGGWEATADLAELEIRAGIMDSAEQQARDLIAIAQVHATLALAAATALNDGERGMTRQDYGVWRDACGVTS